MREPVSFYEFSYIFKKGFNAGADEATDPNASGAYVWEARLPGEYARYLETFENDFVCDCGKEAVAEYAPCCSWRCWQKKFN